LFIYFALGSIKFQKKKSIKIWNNIQIVLLIIIIIRSPYYVMRNGILRHINAQYNFVDSKLVITKNDISRKTTFRSYQKANDVLNEYICYCFEITFNKLFQFFYSFLFHIPLETYSSANIHLILIEFCVSWCLALSAL
jgi:hypothetical protein